VLALGVGWEAWITRNEVRELPHGFTLAIAAGGAICQEILSRFALRTSRKVGSGALRATAWDYRLDVLVALAVVVGIALVRWGGPAWRWADHAAAGVVVLAILWVAGKLLWENIQELMDRQADPGLIDLIRHEALAVPGVLGVETLRIRKAGIEHLVDIHVEVDPEKTVREGHAIAHAVKDRVIRQVRTVRDVLVHIEPCDDEPGRIDAHDSAPHPNR
jgi:cation diffusion facilitator family transporter